MPLSIDQSRFTLLVVDDEPNVLAAIRRHLKSYPIELITTNSTTEASKILDEKAVHVLLADYRMPDISGIEFCRISKERWPKTIRIILSGQLDLPKAQAKVTPDLVFNFLVKPWQDLELIVELENAFKEWRLRNSLLTLKAEAVRINTEEAEMKRRFDEASNLRAQRTLLSKKILEKKHKQLKFLLNLIKTLSAGTDKNSLEEVLQKEMALLLENNGEDILNEITPQINLAHKHIEYLSAIRTVSSQLVVPILNPIKELITFLELFEEDFDEEGLKKIFSTLRDELRLFIETFERYALHKGVENHEIDSEIDLNEITEKSLLLLKALILKNGVTVLLNLKPNILKIFGSQRALEKVSYNLIANALKSLENGGTLTIETKCDDRGFVYLIITDNGKGIASSDLSTIFNPLSNMNLASSQAIIKRLGGNILIATKRNEGTKLTISIPRAGGRECNT